MSKPRSRPQLSLTSAHQWDDAAGIGPDHWCRKFFEHIYSKLDDADFAHLYEEGGRYPISPVLLTCITILQYMFGQSDRAAVQNTIMWRDWRIALGRDRYWVGFDPSVLCNFRKRLMQHGELKLIFNRVLERVRALKLLEGRRLLRVDATRLLADMADLSRFDAVREAVRIVVCNLPEFRPKVVDRPEFRRVEQEYGREVWLGFHDKIERLRWVKLGTDAQLLLRLCGPYPVKGRDVLERMLAENFEIVEGDDEHIPRALELKERPHDTIITPHEPDVRSGKKNDETWRGDKAHFVETADPDRTNFIVGVEVTDPRIEDSQMTARLACEGVSQVPEAEVLLGDSGYASGENSKLCKAIGIDLIAPPRRDNSKTPIPASSFLFDFTQQIGICPEGHTSISWRPHGRQIDVRFRAATCRQCPRYSECVRTKAREGRTVRISRHYDQLQIDRQRAQTAEWKKLYKLRNPIEATISELVHCCHFRRSRYRGAAKRTMHALFAAAALNVRRLLVCLCSQDTPEQAGACAFCAAA